MGAVVTTPAKADRRGRPTGQAEPCPGSVSLGGAAPCRLNDQDSRAKFQYVRGDS